MNMIKKYERKIESPGRVRATGPWTGRERERNRITSLAHRNGTVVRHDAARLGQRLYNDQRRFRCTALII